jgi:CRISPR-associated endonuclease Csn1
MTTLGLDIGTNSIGWCLASETRMIDAGVRIFPVGVKEDDYNKSGSEISKNAARRNARTARRLNQRYKLRRKQLQQLLVELEMQPGITLLHLSAKDLYSLRRKALDEQISLSELGRIFFLLNQRRGFKSSKKDGGAVTEKEKSEMKKAMHELEVKVLENNCRTIGEYFYLLFLQNNDIPGWHNPHEPVERIRKRFVERKLYSKEFDLIWEKQKEYYPLLLSDENKRRIKDECIFYQRPLKSAKHLVGKCRFEEKKRCMPVSHTAYQQFRIWQRIHDMRITDKERFNDPLTIAEKTKLFAAFNEAEQLTKAEIKKVLGLSKNAVFNDLPDKIKGNTTVARLMAALGKVYWGTLTLSAHQRLWHTLFFASDEDWLAQHAVKKLGLTEEQAIAYAAVNLEEGYGSLSAKALLKGAEPDVAENGILHYLEKGLAYTEACAAAGYHHSLEKLGDGSLNKIIIKPDDYIRNPLVQQCMSETVRLINSIIKQYGKPDNIRVEMARSLKKAKADREQIKRRNDDTERRRDGYRDFLRERLGKNQLSKSELIKFELFLEMEYAETELKKLNGTIDLAEFRRFASNVKPSDSLKYRLWLECGRISPYTGNIISLSKLFSSDIDIEHIIPYSRCMDDSFLNKSLCEHAFNADIKSNKMPYEVFGSDNTQWKIFRERIKHFPSAKQERFLLEAIPDGFLNSQLNNTAYAGRMMKQYLSQVCTRVQVTNGQATSYLRRFWGLNGLLDEPVEAGETDNPDNGAPLAKEKNREDHRHHAIDAMVIAFTTPYYVNILSRESQFDGLGRMQVKGIKFPYEAFKLEANELLWRMMISYRNEKRLLTWKKNNYRHSRADTPPQRTLQVRGALHEETNYGQIRHPETGEPVYVIRRDITGIDKEAHIAKVVDADIRDLLKNHIEQNGGDIKKAMSVPLYRVSMKNGQEIRVPVKKVRMAEKATLIQLRPVENPKLFVASGNNYCFVLYGTNEKDRQFETVSFYDAAQRARKREPIIQPEKNGKPLICSLMQKDMVVLYQEHPDEIDWNNQRDLFTRLCRVIKFDIVGQIFFGKHQVARFDEKRDRNKYFFQQRYSTMKAIKVKVDLLGKIVKEQG